MAAAARTVVSSTEAAPSTPPERPASASTSSRTTTSASRSERVAATCSCRARSDTRQSIRRSRSPGAKTRTPASSPPSPGRREWCAPTRPAARGMASTASNGSVFGYTRTRTGSVITARDTSIPPAAATRAPAGPIGCRPHRSAVPASSRSTAVAAGTDVTNGRSATVFPPAVAPPANPTRSIRSHGETRLRTTATSYSTASGLPSVTVRPISAPSTRWASSASIHTSGSARGRRRSAYAVPSANGVARTTRSTRPSTTPASSSRPVRRTARPSARVGVQPATGGCSGTLGPPIRARAGRPRSWAGRRWPGPACPRAPHRPRRTGPPAAATSRGAA